MPTLEREERRSSLGDRLCESVRTNILSVAAPEPPKPARQRIPASERRKSLISAAVHEFAIGGLHGTPVASIARRADVAQPYVFSLFPTKRDLFLAAVERAFENTRAMLEQAAIGPTGALTATGTAAVLDAMRRALVDALTTGQERDWLLLQHQAYAACADEVVRESVRALYGGLLTCVKRLSAATDEDLKEFFQYGMWINVMAALGSTDGGTRDALP